MKQISGGSDAGSFIVIGGGLSGLSVLHALALLRKPGQAYGLRLLEKETRPGGTIGTVLRDECLFEQGPNGFLDSRASTLALLKELGLDEELLRADRQAADRFISIGGKLHSMPTSPLAMLRFSPMNAAEKFRILAEPFIARATDPKETIYAFGRRRLGDAFARYFLDPMVSGIFAGDASKLVLGEAFPRIHEIELEHGSLIRGMFKLMAQRKSRAKAGQPAGEMRSLRLGMGQLTDTLAKRYTDLIHYHEEVRSIRKADGKYIVESSRGAYKADQVIISSPAYAAATMIKDMDRELSQSLSAVPYAAIAVVGFSFPLSAFITRPRGFGYLIPSGEQKKVLGVLLCSNLFAGRSAAGEIMLRVMIGGARHPEVLDHTDEVLFKIAQDEIRSAWGLNAGPRVRFLARWPRAIPQYNVEYIDVKRRIIAQLQCHQGLHIASNFIGGISMNDCTHNAQLLAKSLSVQNDSAMVSVPGKAFG